MPRRAAAKFSQKDLTKGQLRKLNALKKSLGDDIAMKAFGEWYSSVGSAEGMADDKNAMLITEALQTLVKKSGLRIPRGGYILRRGRGRVIVERGKPG